MTDLLKYFFAGLPITIALVVFSLLVGAIKVFFPWLFWAALPFIVPTLIGAFILCEEESNDD